MGTVEDIQAKDFKEEINNEKPVVIEFWIKSCGNCKKFKPVYKELSIIFNETLTILFHRLLVQFLLNDINKRIKIFSEKTK